MAWDEAQYAIDEIKKSMGSGQANGIPPMDMGSNIVITPGNGEAKIKCTPPQDTIVEGQLLCTVGGVRIIRKIGTPPIDQNDGDLVSNVPAGTSYNQKDTGLTNGITYYYGVFPYSDHGVFNIDPSNIREVTPQPFKFWAFDQNFADLNPSTTITYPSGFENSSFAKMHTNKDTGTPTAGGWLPFLQNVLKNYPYMVRTPDATADYALNLNDYSKKASDGSASAYNNANYAGGCFAWINKIYMKEEYASDGNSRRVQFADGPADGFLPIGFYDQDQNEIEGVWIPMCGMPTNAPSKTIFSPGTNVVTNYQIEGFKIEIEKNGQRAVFFGGPIINVLRDLLYMLFKTTDLRTACGEGTANNGVSGQYNNLAKSGPVSGWYGTKASTKTANLMFHSTVFTKYALSIADPYYMVRGNNRMTSVSPFYNYSSNGAGYIDIENVTKGPTGGYPSKLKKGPEYWGSIVDFTSTNGGSSTGLTTYFARASSFESGSYYEALRNGGYAQPGITQLYFGRKMITESSSITAATMLLPNPGYSPFS